jgi:magnesium-transporting ATPase (P-type)
MPSNPPRFSRDSKRAQGLAQNEAVRRLETYGLNRLPQGKRSNALIRFLHQFHNLLIYVLLMAGALAAAIGHVTDALVILAVVVANAIIGFIQEGRAETALEAISGMIGPRASVVRNGRRVTIAADEVAPGDIVLL